MGDKGTGSGLEQLQHQVIDATPGTPAAQTRFIEADYRAWRDVVRTQNLKIE